VFTSPHRYDLCWGLNSLTVKYNWVGWIFSFRWSCDTHKNNRTQHYNRQMYACSTNLQGPRGIPEFHVALFEVLLCPVMCLFQSHNLCIMQLLQHPVGALMKEKMRQNVSAKCTNKATNIWKTASYCPHKFPPFNPLTPNGHHSGRTAPLTSRRCILNIYSTNIHTEYFKHAA
jgi:hypothetical protein